jgi:hypothetical protein
VGCLKGSKWSKPSSGANLFSASSGRYGARGICASVQSRANHPVPQDSPLKSQSNRIKVGAQGKQLYVKIICGGDIYISTFISSPTPYSRQDLAAYRVSWTVEHQNFYRFVHGLRPLFGLNGTIRHHPRFSTFGCPSWTWTPIALTWTVAATPK